MPDPDPLKVEQAKNDLLDAMTAASVNNSSTSKPLVVSAVKSLASSDQYTAEEKQQAFVAVAKEVVARECDAAMEHPSTLMRGNTVNTQFMGAYLEEHAKEFKNVVLSETAGQIGQLKIPKEGFTKQNHPSSRLDRDNIPMPGQRSDGPEIDRSNAVTLSPKVQQQWDALYQDAAQIIVDANNNNIDKLSPEAQEFLKACSDVTREKFANHPQVDSLVSAQTANNCILRLTAPAVSTMKGTSENSVEKAVQDIMFTRGSQAAQSYVNRFDHDTFTLKNTADAITAELRKNDALKQKTQAAFHAASNATASQFQPAPLPLPSAANQSTTQSVPSVRDMLKSTASSIKNTLMEKMGLDDQSKLNRMDKQIAKRENHLQVLQDRKDAVDAKLASPDVQKALNTPYDPQKAAFGSSEERAQQMDIADARDLKKQSDKLGARIGKNEEKVGKLDQKRDAHEQKMELRAARNASKEEVKTAVRVK